MPNFKNEKRVKNRFLVWLGERLGPIMLKFLYNTNTWVFDGDQNIKEEIISGKSIIIASWHGTLLTVFMGLANKNYFGMAGNHHPEAEIISRVGKKLGGQLLEVLQPMAGKKRMKKWLGL